MKKPTKNMTGEDIEHCLGMLKDALSVSEGQLQVGEILSFFETECKRVLSLFHDVPPESISNLADANETFWLEREFPHYASPFGEAISALAAIFFLRDDLALRDSYADDFAVWAREEADMLGVRLKTMRHGELETEKTLRSVTGSANATYGGQVRGEELADRNQEIITVAKEFLAKYPRHEIIGKLKKRGFPGPKGDPLSEKQLRNILRQEKIIPPPQKRKRR